LTKCAIPLAEEVGTERGFLARPVNISPTLLPDTDPGAVGFTVGGTGIDEDHVGVTLTTGSSRKRLARSQSSTLLDKTGVGQSGDS